MRIVTETDKPIAQVAPDLGISRYTLHNWVQADRRRTEQTISYLCHHLGWPAGRTPHSPTTPLLNCLRHPAAVPAARCRQG